MSKDREKILAERKKLKTQYRELFDEVSAILFRHDPIGINFETNTDEYESEVGAILPRLKECRSPSDVLDVVHEEFIRWFDDDTAGPRSHYAEISKEIFEAWQKYASLDNLRRARAMVPFAPFTIRLSDGRTLRVRQSEFIAVSPCLVVVIGEDGYGVSHVDPRSIESIEPLR